MSTDDYPLSTNGIVKNYGPKTTIGPISMNIGKKWIFGFLGPNGAGKTTTIRMILGLSKPNNGSVTVFGRDPSKDPERALKNIGYAPELPNFQTFFSGEDLLNFVAKLYRLSTSERRTRVRELLEMVGLRDHAEKKIGKYSKGMVQRLSVAQALINDPDLVIMDEPTLGMDPAATIYFRDLFKTLVSDGRTIFISSHQLDEVQKIATHVGMINKGKMVFQGTTPSILDAFAKDYSIEVELETINQKILEKIGQLDYIDQVKVINGKIQIKLNEKRDLRATLAEDIIKNGGRLLGMALNKATLEDAFVETLRGEMPILEKN